MADLDVTMLLWCVASVLLCVLVHAFIKRLYSDNSKEPAASKQSPAQTPCTRSRIKPKSLQETKEDAEEDVTEEEHQEMESTGESKPTKVKKRPLWKGSKNEYSHPWLLKSLKGHPGTVLHVDMSSNGKYIASTCEEAAGTPTPPLSSPSPSRRRKPRGRLRPPPAAPPARLPPDELAAALWPHLLTPERMWSLGYPLEFEPNSCKAVLYASPPPRLRGPTYFDVNAPEFVPGGGSGSPDSGRGSGGSSPHTDSDEEADPGAVDHVCVRCDSVFRVGSDGDYITRERCLYHWGRPSAGAGGALACCGGALGSRGCSVARLHVWNGTRPGMNGPLDGYVRARTRRGGVYSLDTEMCYTTAGLELASVAVVGADGRLVYRATVRPRAPVIDYNTRFSGIRQRDLERATKTLRDVQNDILGFVGSDTVLVGHALDNDLRALKLLHSAVVDTCALYPHARGFPLRRSLRVLSAELLGRSVQEGPHSPLEDARAALDLVLLRAHEERPAAR